MSVVDENSSLVPHLGSQVHFTFPPPCVKDFLCQPWGGYQIEGTEMVKWQESGLGACGLWKDRAWLSREDGLRAKGCRKADVSSRSQSPHGLGLAKGHTQLSCALEPAVVG